MSYELLLGLIHVFTDVSLWIQKLNLDHAAASLPHVKGWFTASNINHSQTMLWQMWFGDGRLYLLTGPRSQISALRKGTNEAQQKGQDEFRLESSDVQPAMISSSYTNELQLRHREQLDINTWTQREGLALTWKTTFPQFLTHIMCLVLFVQDFIYQVLIKCKMKISFRMFWYNTIFVNIHV